MKHVAVNWCVQFFHNNILQGSAATHFWCSWKFNELTPETIGERILKIGHSLAKIR